MHYSFAAHLWTNWFAFASIQNLGVQCACPLPLPVSLMLMTVPVAWSVAQTHRSAAQDKEKTASHVSVRARIRHGTARDICSICNIQNKPSSSAVFTCVPAGQTNTHQTLNGRRTPLIIITKARLLATASLGSFRLQEASYGVIGFMEYS